MSAYGVHVFGELYGCAHAALDDEALVREAMREAARRAGATIVTDFVHRFSPHGLSGVVVIAESHLTIHTWPEDGFAAVDLFTCGQTLRPEVGIQHLVEALGSRRHTLSTAQRGARHAAEGAPHATRAHVDGDAHVEQVGPGRSMTLALRAPWIVDVEERLALLDGRPVRVQIGDFETFGRGLVLDGAVQLTESIDAAYTRALVFPAALSAASRRRWLIVGGGDGAAAREALRFRDTERVRLVDVSPAVIANTQAHIPSFWGGCQRDPRLEVVVADAWGALSDMAARGEQVDVLLFDLSDPADDDVAAPSDRLYSLDAFRLAARCLAPGGVFAAQLGELSPYRHRHHRRQRQLLSTAFRHVRSYRTWIEPFGCAESFVVASNAPGPWDPARGDGVAEALAARYVGDWRSSWSAAWHEQLFALPPDLARILDAPDDVTRRGGQ